MQKILLAIDAVHADTKAVDLAAYIAARSNSPLTGIFLENLLKEDRPAELIAEGLHYSLQGVMSDSELKREVIEENIRWFRQACHYRGIVPSVHRDRGLPLQELLQETRYADLLILNATTSFGKRFDGRPSQFVQEVLLHTECPAIIAPETFSGSIDELVFACDGSSSSVFAFRQFTYLFPDWAEQPVSILEIASGQSRSSAHSNQYLMQEWLKRHYSNISIDKKIGKTDVQLMDYLLRKPNAMLVMGSFGRSGISQFLQQSQAKLLLQSLSSPVFITHR